MHLYLIIKQSSRQTRSTRQTKNKAYTLKSLWLMMGILLGILGSYVCFVAFNNSSLTSKLLKKDIAGAVISKADKIKKNNSSENSNLAHQAHPKKIKEPKTQFDFYQLLPEMIIPSSKSNAYHDVNKQNVTPPLAHSAQILKENNTSLPQFFLLLGEFGQKKQAEELQAQLALQGYNPHLQTSKTGHLIIFRVKIGPFDAENIALNYKARLLEHKFSSTLLVKK